MKFCFAFCLLFGLLMHCVLVKNSVKLELGKVVPSKVSESGEKAYFNAVFEGDKGSIKDHIVLVQVIDFSSPINLFASPEDPDDKESFSKYGFRYSLIQNSQKTNKKLILPVQNFLIHEREGQEVASFTIISECPTDCKDLQLEFSLIKKSETLTTLERNEVISVATIRDTTTYKFKIKSKPENDNTALHIILTESDKPGLALTIKGKEHEPLTHFKNGLGFIYKENNETNIEVTCKENSYFTLETFENKILRVDSEANYLISRTEEETYKVEQMDPNKNYQISIVKTSNADLDLTIGSETTKCTETRTVLEKKGFSEIKIKSNEVQGIMIQITNNDGRINIIKINDEPLLNLEKYSETLKKGEYKVYRHMAYYDNAADLIDSNSHELSVTAKAGMIEVYYDKTAKFPFYEINNATIEQRKTDYDNQHFKEIFGPLGFYYQRFDSTKEFHLGSPQQMIFIVKCISNDCKYEVLSQKMGDTRILSLSSRTFKFIPKTLDTSKPIRDKFQIDKVSEKMVIDLIVYYGDAYFYEFEKGQCKMEEKHLGANQRIILTCPKTANENIVKFTISASEDSFYYITPDIRDSGTMNEEIPVGLTYLQEIKTSETDVIKLFKPTSEKLKILSIFNPMDCQLNIYHKADKEQKRMEAINYYEIFQMVTNSSTGEEYYNISISKQHHQSDKRCLYYVSSYDMNDNFSYLTIPEAKPFRFAFNKDVSQIRVAFPYGMINENDKIYLRVNLFSNKRVKLTKKVGHEQPKVFTFHENRVFILAHSVNSCPIYGSCKIEMNFELLDKGELLEGENMVVDLIIKTANENPFTIESEMFYSDIVLTNKTQYYLTTLNSGDRAEIDINFKRGSGVIFAKLLNNNTKEDGGWNNRIILPTINDLCTDDSKSIYYDFYRQKLIVRRDLTKELCVNDFCYFVFGVRTTNEYIAHLESEYHSQFSIYYKKYPEGEFSLTNKVLILNNEIVSGSINTDSKEVYSNEFSLFTYKIDDDIPFLQIEYNSHTCDLGMFINDPTSGKNITLQSTGEPRLWRKTKKEIIKDFQIEGDTLKDSIVYIYFQNEKQSGIFDSKFKFRIYAPPTNKNAQHVFFADADGQIMCDKSVELGYCDYIVPVYYDTTKDVALYGITSKIGRTEVYVNIIDSNKYGNFELTDDDKPTKDKHKYPSQGTSNFIQIPYKDTPDDQYILYVRVYPIVQEKTPSYLLASNIELIQKITPPSDNFMIFNVPPLLNITINIPDDHYYSVTFMTIKGSVNIHKDNNEYSLSSELDNYIITTEKNKDTFIFQRPKGEENSYVMVTYNLRPDNQNIDALDVGMGSRIIYGKQEMPVKIYSALRDVNSDLTLSFILRKFITKETNHNIQRETHVFKSVCYLLTQEQLQEIKKGRGIPEQAEEIQGSSDISTRIAFVTISKKRIEDFKAKYNNTNTYALLVISKDPQNPHAYSVINAYINSYQSVNIHRMIKPLYPVFGFHDASSPYPMLKLGKDDDTDSKMEIEFSCNHKFIEPIVVKNKEETVDNVDYFSLKKLEVAGKTIIRVNKNLNDAILKMKSKKNGNEQFTYFLKYSSDTLNYVDYTINSDAQYTYDANKAQITKIKFKKPKINGKIINDIEYYVRIYNQKNTETSSKNTIISEGAIDAYQVNLDKNDSEDVEITYDFDVTAKDYYIDILARHRTDGNNRLFSYDKYYPYTGRKGGDIPTDDTKSNKTLYIIIGAVGGVVVIGIIGLIIYVCKLKKANEDLESKVRQVTFSKGNNREGGDNLLGEA